MKKQHQHHPANLVEVPIQGQRLPANWQEQAKHRAAMAEAAYKFNLENAWKRGFEGNDPNTARNCRLSGQPSWQDLLGDQ